MGGLQKAREEVLNLRKTRNGMTLPEEESAAVMRHAHKLRNIRQNGARTTNRSAAKDATDTASRVEAEVSFYCSQCFPCYLMLRRF
jgi:hypothetical protein